MCPIQPLMSIAHQTQVPSHFQSMNSVTQLNATSVQMQIHFSIFQNLRKDSWIKPTDPILNIQSNNAQPSYEIS